MCQNSPISRCLLETLNGLTLSSVTEHEKRPVFLSSVTWKDHIVSWRLSRMPAAERERKGCSLRHANSVGLVYLEREHAHYREVKALAKRLKDEFGVRRVGMMSFVQKEAKDTPTWLVKKLDSGYFCKSDLNWYGWPVKEIQAFVDTPFDILIDLELDPVLPLKYVVRASAAGMKVGVNHPTWSRDLDLQVVRSVAVNDEDVDEVDVILQDPMDDWREHTEKTIVFLKNIDLQ